MASDDWEFHKNTISCLILLERLSVKELSARMKEEHNFDKKKHQYDYQIKKWGFKKNARGDLWRYVGHEVQKRKKLGKKSEITLFGMRLPQDKVHKETQRYTTITTAKEFGRDIPSPANPGSDIVRIMTPTPENSRRKWPETLPWLKFMRRFQIDHIIVPGIGKGLVWGTQSPQALYAKIDRLARSIPRNHERHDECPQSSLWTGGPSAIAVESLKIILFSLANKDDNALRAFQLSTSKQKDVFVLWLLDRISESNLKWSIGVESNCSTTNAISEVIWACAIRQKRYDVTLQLIKAGIDLHMPVDGMYHNIYMRSFERGKLHMSIVLPMPDFLNALESAVIHRDIRLAQILLEADANASYISSLLEFMTFTSEECFALEFVELLLSYAVELDVLPPLGVAIAKHYNNLVKIWIDKVDQTQLISYPPRIDWKANYLLKIDCTLLHIAIASENAEIANFLLRATLARPDSVPKKALKELLMVACLAGDRSTIEQLFRLNVDWGIGDWPGGISPLVATAWNPDTGIAEMILQAGAFSEHDIGSHLQATTSPLPIHVATRAGNTNFVQWLIGDDRNLNTQFNPPYKLSNIGHQYSWLVPSNLATPLQLALESGSVPTIIQCRHATLLGGELTQAIRLGDERVISDLLSRDSNITFIDSNGNTVLEAAAEVGNRDIILLHFSLGGTYRSSAFFKAVQAAMTSRDDSIVSLLAMKRPVQTIDRFEATALVIAIREKWLPLVNILLGEKFLPASISSLTSSDHFPKGFIRTVSMLLGSTPLVAAFSSGDIELAKRMHHVGYRAQPIDLNSARHVNTKDIVSLFWTHFPPSNANLKWARHLLHATIQWGMTKRSHECIAYIHRFEYYITNRTPLQLAVEHGNTSVMDLLIKNGASVNAPAARAYGVTTLQAAAIRGFMDIARTLLEHGADVNAAPAKISGRTALEGASEQGKLDMVQFLLENGIRLDGAMRIHYIRAVAYARMEGHYAIAKLLKDFGGWTDRDQQVYDREDILNPVGYFIFDDETHDWRLIQKASTTRSHRTDDMSISSRTTSSDRLTACFSDDTGSEDDRDDSDELGSVIKEEDDYHETFAQGLEGEDMGLLMERYLEESFGNDLSNFEINEDEFQNGYVQDPDEYSGHIIQELDDDHGVNMPEWWEPEIQVGSDLTQAHADVS